MWIVDHKESLNNTKGDMVCFGYSVPRLRIATIEVIFLSYVGLFYEHDDKAV